MFRLRTSVRHLLAICLLLFTLSACAARKAEAPPSTMAYAPTGEFYDGGGYEAQGISVARAESAPMAALGDDDVRSQVERERASVDRSQPNPERKFIRNAWLTLELRDEDDFGLTLEQVRGLATSLGGYVQSESSTSMSIMIPTEQIDQGLEAMTRLGKVTHKNVSVVDATANYYDMQIRIDNLRKMRVRLTELVNQSTSVTDVLAVEKELARVTSELERLEGQMRLLGQQTSYATIHVSLEERVKPGPLGWVFYGLGKGVKWLFIRN